jgi:hypothetical protein
MTKKAAWETLKFLVRIVILIGLPQLVLYLTNAGGNWVTVADALSVIDKWVHEDSRIPAKGLLPF